MWRVYKADYGLVPYHWNVTTPPPPAAAGGGRPFALKAFHGNYAYIGQGKGKEADLDRVEGIYTGTMGDCIGVAFLFGRHDKYRGHYSHASLAHLSGGASPSAEAWAKLRCGLTAAQIEGGCAVAPYWGQCVVCTTVQGYGEGHSVNKLCEEIQEECGFPDECLTVYVGSIPGFGVDKRGWCGTVDWPAKSDLFDEAFDL